MDIADPEGNVAELGLLADDVRRRLYRFVAASTEPVTRDDAAAAIGIGRTLAAYHLDKLSQGGLLDVSYARPEGRTGPGSGRPAKRYTRARREIAVSFPPRNYSLLAQILATAADATPSSRLREALTEAAQHEGEELGSRATSIPLALTTAGYEPATTSDGDIILRNCPFHSIVQEHTDLVCTLNHAFIQGTLQGSGDDPERAELSPCDGRCCIIIHPGQEPPEPPIAA
ncbi:helix-turn-helix domain-containing protein [Humibacter antri]